MMKLAPCPACKKMLSLTATVCPNCGRTMKEGDLIAPETPPMPLWWIVAAILIVIFIFIAAEKGKEINDSRERQIQRMEQTGRDMYR